MALLLRREVWRHKIQIREIKGLHGICRKIKIKSRRAENYIDFFTRRRDPLAPSKPILGDPGAIGIGEIFWMNNQLH